MAILLQPLPVVRPAGLHAFTTAIDSPQKRCFTETQACLCNHSRVTNGDSFDDKVQRFPQDQLYTLWVEITAIASLGLWGNRIKGWRCGPRWRRCVGRTSPSQVGRVAPHATPPRTPTPAADQRPLTLSTGNAPVGSSAASETVSSHPSTQPGPDPATVLRDKPSARPTYSPPFSKFRSSSEPPGGSELRHLPRERLTGRPTRC